MSSSGDVAGAGDGAVPTLYYCHQCTRSVTLTLLPSDELICPRCNSGFLEEVEDVEDNLNQNPNPNAEFFHHPLFPIGGGGGSGGGGQRSAVNAFHELFEGPTTFNLRQSFGFVPAPVPEQATGFSPFAFLQEYFSNARAGGAEFRIVLNGQEAGDPGFHMPSNFGDYFVGPGFEELIQQLAENDPNRYGTPPASRSAVEALPTILVDEGLLKSELAQCAVCKDDFEAGLEVKQMPCKHVYHSDCILPWLELHNSCPVCRYELPTDDPDYQSGGGNVGAAEGSSGSGSVGPSPASRARERRYNTIMLNWPFSRLGEDDGSSGGGNNDGDSNSGGRQSRGWM